MPRIDALLEERRGYVLRNLPDRVAQVDAEIKRLGGVVVDDAPQIETATVEAPEAAAVRRGRPRKAV